MFNITDGLPQAWCKNVLGNRPCMPVNPCGRVWSGDTLGVRLTAKPWRPDGPGVGKYIRAFWHTTELDPAPSHRYHVYIDSRSKTHLFLLPSSYFSSISL